MPFRGVREDPFRNFKFRVTIGRDFSSQTGFSRVSGLKEQTEVVEYREGTDAATPRKLFGQTTFDNVTFERGITNDRTLLDWRRMISDIGSGAGRGGTAEGNGQDDVRRSITVELIEYHARPSWTWELLQCWPVSLEIGEFAGDGNDVVIETMEIAHEGMVVGTP